MPVIELKNISHRFGQNWALKNITFSVKAGEAVALFGPNASGKSTLLKILSTRLKPTKGEGTILDQDIRNGVSKIRSATEWLGHELAFYKTLTARENLAFHFKLKGGKSDDEKIEHVLEKVNLDLSQNKPLHSFSRGQLKRLALARILLENPKIILLDEPHTNLDQEGKALMNQLLLEWKKEGVTLLMASHEQKEILPLCDKVLLLKEGQNEIY